MSQDLSFMPSPARGGHRGTALALAGTCTLLLMGGIAGSFHGASQLAWLAPTAVNVAAVDGCRQLQRPDAQRGCLERVVAAAKVRQSVLANLAQAGGASGLESSMASTP